MLPLSGQVFKQSNVVISGQVFKQSNVVIKWSSI